MVGRENKLNITDIISILIMYINLQLKYQNVTSIKLRYLKLYRHTSPTYKLHNNAQIIRIEGGGLTNILNYNYN